MEESQLLRLQRRFKADILNETSSSVADLKSTKAFSPFRRLDVYRNTKTLLISFIAEDHPILAEHLGGEKLEELIEQFLRARPSTSTNKADVSAGFHQYLQQNKEPILGEIARFDWLQVLAAAELEDTRQYTPIAQLQEEDLAEAQLVMDSTLQLFEGPFAVHLDNSEKPTFLAIRSVKNEIEIAEFDKHLFGILQALIALKSLPGVLTELTDAELSPDVVSQAFMDWVKDGTIVGFMK